jgi:hypothetical protein
LGQRDRCRVLIGPTFARQLRHLVRISASAEPAPQQGFRRQLGGPDDCLKIVVSPLRVRVSPSSANHHTNSGASPPR